MSETRAVLLALVLVLTALGPVGAASGTANPNKAASTNATAQPTEIRSCTTITRPGTYVLARDVVPRRNTTNLTDDLSACISIRASDVVLDGQGHTLDGEKRYPAPGILASTTETLRNVTVRNLTATGWGAGVGFVRVRDPVVRNVTAVENLGDGVVALGSQNATIADVTARHNGIGVFVFDSPRSVVSGTTASENAEGLRVVRSAEVTVEDVVASDNDLTGLGVFRSDRVTVADGRFEANVFAGVALFGSERGRLRNLTVTDTTAVTTAEGPAGVHLRGSTARLSRSLLRNNSAWAVYASQDSRLVGRRVELAAGERPVSFEASDVAVRGARVATSGDDEAALPPLPTERQVVWGALVADATAPDGRLELRVRYRNADVVRARALEETLAFYRTSGENWSRVATKLDVEANVAAATFANLNETGIALVGEGLAEAESGTENETES